jgi:hypothetical protein
LFSLLLGEARFRGYAAIRETMLTLPRKTLSMLESVTATMATFFPARATVSNSVSP